MTLVLLVSLPLRLASSQSPVEQEYAIKAAYLLNFCRFIDWPSRAFSGPDDPMVIGVVGENPFGGLLDETVGGETVAGRRIRIEYHRRAAEIGRCHVLFVSESEANRFDDIIERASGKSVVTVGETDAFLDRGGMIALIAEQKRVRLRIHLTRLRAENLVATSKLLRVAELRR